MTGPEHYREAEHLLRTFKRHPDSSDAVALVTAAQTHATLALAAATALSADRDMPAGDGDAWRSTVSANAKKVEGETR